MNQVWGNRKGAGGAFFANNASSVDATDRRVKGITRKTRKQ